MTSDEKRREVAKRMPEKMYLLSESDLREISDDYNADYNKPLMKCTEWLADHECKEWTRYTDGEPVRPGDTVLARVERCRNVSGHQDTFECSECRCRAELVTEVCNEYGEPFHVPLMPSFCPVCGAMVVEMEEDND